MKQHVTRLIFPLALLSLLLGIITGWQRINWDIPLVNLAGDHGALMTGSFVGTLICLERSILHPNKWWRLLPFVNGISIFLFLLHAPQAGYLLLIAGSAGPIVLMVLHIQSHPQISQALLIMGAFAWLTGNLVLLIHHAYPLAVKWWMLFWPNGAYAYDARTNGGG